MISILWNFPSNIQFGIKRKILIALQLYTQSHILLAGASLKDASVFQILPWMKIISQIFMRWPIGFMANGSLERRF